MPREMLYVADELFFAGTAVEITPITSVDRITVGDGKRGPMTKALQDAFFGVVRGEHPDRHGWLHAVPRGSAARGRRGDRATAAGNMRVAIGVRPRGLRAQGAPEARARGGSGTRSRTSAPSRPSRRWTIPTSAFRSRSGWRAATRIAASCWAAAASARRSPPTRSPAIRAAVVTSDETARLTRLHNDSNVLALGGRTNPDDDAVRLAAASGSRPGFEGGRHVAAPAQDHRLRGRALDEG